ncbi:MAG: AGE family epimerase/isomerase, partial [Saprospiraceae bacterium]
MSERLALADTIEHLLRTNLVDIWYPTCIDTVYGGYLTSFDKDFHPGTNQQKMIVSQGRLLWNASKAAIHWPADKQFMAYAKHGFEFLRDKMWDKQYGGFYQLVDQVGNPLGDTAKTAYGNSFGLYGAATYYMMSKDPEGLDLAKKTFTWLEDHSHDPVHKGYYQHLTKTGAVIQRPASTPSTSDLGYKDQNSSIHLLEAMTALYEVWPDPLVKSRLEEMIYLVRDTIVNEKGNLVLFFKPDWTPISFRDSSHEVIEHQHLD